MADEPFVFFLVKNVLVFGALVYMSWLMAGFRGLPNVFIVMALLIVVYSFVTDHTTFGRRIYAVGGNEKAAALSGINRKRLVFLTFANMGMLAALAGLVSAARLNTATPKAGEGFELDVIAAVFIGGASMAGRVRTVVGAVIGAFIMGVMNTGMSILGIGIDYQQTIKGLVLLAAVIFDELTKKRLKDMSFRKADWPRRLRSRKWYGGTSRHNIYHRGWLKNQGYPDDLFDGRPVIGVLNT
jgi:putative multiple sugar transport system permease protein